MGTQELFFFLFFFERGKKGDSLKLTSKLQKTAYKKKGEGQEGSTGLLALAHTLAICHSNSNAWIIDSGATCRICCDRSLFSVLEDLEEPEG